MTPHRPPLNSSRYIVIFALLSGVILLLTGCDLMSDRLLNVGRLPELSRVNIYEEQVDPVSGYARAASGSGSLYKDEKSAKKRHNTVWAPHAQSFFESYRIGDVVSVVISVKDKARLDNQTQKGRKGQASVGVSSFFGLEKKVNAFDPSTMVAADASADSSGSGKINRSEVVETTVAATVVRILPSGNLYIKGSQEIRVNYEIRQVTVEGIVRHNDIDGNNSVKLEKIAEARISYGGRGNISEGQQGQYGSQIADIISPF